METSFRKKIKIAIITLFVYGQSAQLISAQKSSGKQQLMKDIEVLNTASRDYNSKPQNDKNKIDSTLSSFETLMGRKLNDSERSFLSSQFSTMKELPTFELKENHIELYSKNKDSKNETMKVEIVNLEKNIFKFAGKTFQLDPNKAIHENIQVILKELNKPAN